MSRRPDPIPLSGEILRLLACPKCRGRLAPRGELLVCAGCAVGYPVRDGVPVLLADQALPLGEESRGQ